MASALEREAVQLERQPALHPELREALREAEARVFWLVPPFSETQDALNSLHATFLRSLCGEEFLVFVYHLFWQKRGRELADFVERLRRIEPSVRLHEVEFQGSRSRRWFKSGRRYPELMMRTRSLEALKLMFEEGHMHITFEDWLIDPPGTRFPVEAFRTLEPKTPVSTAQFWKSMAEGHVAYLYMQEEHGPMVVTSKLSDDHVTSAALAAAIAIGRPLIMA
ncbi:MAG TPA: hypothetical protein VJN63_07305 [Thermoplasmata archaeon]|nr:hypothetical protein [Thermoplasmata archaeon]